MIRITATDAPAQGRSCDALLVDPFVPVLADALGIDTAGGGPRTAPCADTRAVIVAVAGGGDVALGTQAALDAALATHIVRIACIPVEESADHPHFASIVEGRLAGLKRLVDARPQSTLRLVEFLCRDEAALKACDAIVEDRCGGRMGEAERAGPRIVEDDQDRLDAIAEVKRALDEGNLIEAYSRAARHLHAFPDDRALVYLQILALARMGDLAEAQALYDAHGLAKADTESRALGARLKKDAAFRAAGAARQTALAEAARAYLDVAAGSRDVFPLVNAATLSLLAGQRDAARALAQQVLDHDETRVGGTYWAHATRAEALLILGRADQAETEAARAVRQPDASAGSRSSTAHQFERLRGSGDVDPAAIERALAKLRPSPTAFFCGHIFEAEPEVEARLARAVDSLLDETGVRIGYGSAAAGADILIAERLLERGGEVHVVLPLDRDDFVRASVRPAGSDWIARFERVLARATSVRYASQADYVGDPGQFEHGNRVAMGLARLRARHRGCEGIQIAIWDGQPHASEAGTAGSVRAWQRSGGRTRAILPGVIRRPRVAESWDHNSAFVEGRSNNAILFTDFHGFSKIAETRLPRFVDEVLGVAASALAPFDADIVGKNSWGDAIFLVLPDPHRAARAALALQDAVSSFDSGRIGLSSAGMRIAVHYGPTYHARDPLTGSRNFFGGEVSRAARLEPVTPPNSVYVSETFAAVLESHGASDCGLHFAGEVLLAKNSGAIPVYRLSSLAPSPAP